MASPDPLSAFFAEVERRAYRQAWFAVQDEDTALDLVQDAMLRLAERYADRPAEEWPLLFQRILQNAIRDHYRRSKVRSMWTTLLSALSPSRGDEDEVDPLDTLAVEAASEALQPPHVQAERKQTLALIEDCVARLPLRQRQAFLLRYMEELDVAATAAAMGCSEGSVKTHCSRACHTLAQWLRDKGVEL
ncbi:RNA polymerase sigma factor [Chitinimonas koreensis]|uniref:RNA polymerase sigma factor n=1 Tax=Chitinimonas koreensis TaxID=356302 RepID=UPI0004113B27|nr:RNA polymerase sigma factor [Chitinimonas koreensis]